MDEFGRYMGSSPEFGKDVTSEYYRPDPNPQPYGGNEFGQPAASYTGSEFGRTVEPQNYGGEFGQNLGDITTLALPLAQMGEAPMTGVVAPQDYGSEFGKNLGDLHTKPAEPTTLQRILNLYGQQT